MKRTTVGLLVGCLLAFGWFVWPTPYRYMMWSDETGTVPVRISRLTGKADLLTRIGWYTMAPGSKPAR